MGKNLLRLFDPRGGLGALTPLVAGHLTPQDVLNIVKCDPVLWRYRKEILTNLLGMSLGSAELAMQAPIKHAVALCRRITPAARMEVGKVLFKAAAKRGDLAGLQAVFKDFGLTADDARADYNWALRYAAVYGHTDIVKHLTAPVAKGGMGLTADNVQTMGNQALQLAAQYGHTDIVRYLTAPVAKGGMGLTANDARAYDNYALRYASEYGHIDIVRYLTAPVAEGGMGLTANDARAINNWALRHASQNGHTDIVKYLTKPVADGGIGLTAHDIQNSSALQWAKNYPEIERHLQNIVSANKQ